MSGKTRRKQGPYNTTRVREQRALRRHRPVARTEKPPGRLQDTHSQPLVHQIIALAAVGWRIVELWPSLSDGQAALWHVTIARFDHAAKLTVTAEDPDAALAELVRYASSDAPEER